MLTLRKGYLHHDVGFRDGGRKYQDKIINTVCEAGPRIAFPLSPTIKCEINAPVIVKKSPA